MPKKLKDENAFHPNDRNNRMKPKNPEHFKVWFTYTE